MQDKQKTFKDDMQGAANFMAIMLNGHAVTITPFIRTDFGKEGIGFRGLVGFALIFLWGGFMHCPAMIHYFWAWLAAVLIQRIKQFQNWRKGVALHSFYNGYPWLAFKLFPRIKTEDNAKAAEGFMCLAVGGIIAQFNPMLGAYVMLGFVSIIGSQALIVEAYKRRLQSLADAEMEQRYVADQYRRFKR